MKLSKYAYAVYWCRPTLDLRTGKYRSHAHQVQYGDGQQDGEVTEDDLIDMAEEMAESVRGCHAGRHEGHGYAHGQDEVEESFRMAMHMLLNHDYEAEWQEQEHNIAMHKKWGGHMPAAVMFYDQDGDERLIMPDQNGDPLTAKLKPGVLGEVMPPPRGKDFYKDKQGIGYRVPRRVKRERMRRLREQGNG